MPSPAPQPEDLLDAGELPALSIIPFQERDKPPP
jgi:hypothetical protein